MLALNLAEKSETLHDFDGFWLFLGLKLAVNDMW